MQRIIESAAKQSGRGVLPEYHEAADFSKALKNAEGLSPCLKLFAHEKAAVSLKERLSSGFKARGKGKNIVIFIGPEGGFSNAEARAFEENGVLSFSLGRRILRAETAGFAALCLVLYELEG
jgi:16S rRNA (uracil1498-N3)-methyltransferase